MNARQQTDSKTDFVHEVVLVDSGADSVCCDGGNGALGHPQVWYVFEDRSEVTCGYCDRVFRRQQ